MARKESTPQELLDLFKTRTPELAQRFDQMYSLLLDYRASRYGANPVLKHIKEADHALWSVTGKKIRLYDVQLMNIILLTAFPDSQCCLAEISTGEGKTNIILVVAYVKAMQNPHRQVDVITTAETLAIRDAQSETSVAFFKKLGMSVDHKIEIQKSQQEFLKNRTFLLDDGLSIQIPGGYCPLGANILYGTSASFAHMHLFAKADESGTTFFSRRLDHLDTCQVIVDEVDSLLVDSKGNSALLSNSGQRSPYLLAIKSAIFQAIVVNQYQLSFEPGWHDDMKDESEEFATKSKAEMMAYSKEVQLCLTKAEQAIFDSSCTHWIDTCYSALYKRKEGVDYVIQEGQIKIVDFRNTGET